MSDLQCPATVVVVDPAAVSARLHAQRTVAVLAGPAALDTARELARVLDVPCRDLPGAPTSAGGLLSAVDDVADEYRGECVALVVTATALTDLVRRVLPDHATPAVVVEVDADGQRWAPWPVSGPRGR